jgi:hypothetical protein
MMKMPRIETIVPLWAARQPKSRSQQFCTAFNVEGIDETQRESFN